MKRLLPYFAAGFAVILGVWFKTHLERRLVAIGDRSPSLYEASARYEAQSLKRYSLGFDNVIADLIWLRLLEKARHRPAPEGRVSWEFAQLDAVTTLDRNFAPAYPFGSAFLSVFLRDNIGARRILEKWTRYQPTHWLAHYTLAYHLYFEMNEYETAAKHMLTAASLRGAPPWLNVLGVRLLTEAGSLAQALQTALSLVKIVKDTDAAERLLHRVASLNFLVQKAAWNSALADYRANLKREPRSLEELSPHFQGQARQLAQLLDTNDLSNEVRRILSERHSFRYDATVREVVAHPPRPELEKGGISRPQQAS